MIWLVIHYGFNRKEIKKIYISNKADLGQPNFNKKGKNTMRKLNLFQIFDLARWAEGKEFMIQGAKYNDRKGCVTLDVIITEDNTDYGDPAITNQFEKFKVHCFKDVNETDVDKYHVKDMIRFKTYGKCSVYGDYSSQLCVEAVVEVIK